MREHFPSLGRSRSTIFREVAADDPVVAEQTEPLSSDTIQQNLAATDVWDALHHPDVDLTLHHMAERIQQAAIDYVNRRFDYLHGVFEGGVGITCERSENGVAVKVIPFGVELWTDEDVVRDEIATDLATRALTYFAERFNHNTLPGANGIPFKDEVLKPVRHALLKERLLHARHDRAVAEALAASPFEPLAYCPTNVVAVAYLVKDGKVEGTVNSALSENGHAKVPEALPSLGAFRPEMFSLVTKIYPGVNFYARQNPFGLPQELVAEDTLRLIEQELVKDNTRTYLGIRDRLHDEGRENARMMSVATSLCELLDAILS